VLCGDVNIPEVVSMLMPHRIVLWSLGIMALHNWTFRDYIELTTQVPSFIFQKHVFTVLFQPAACCCKRWGVIPLYKGREPWIWVLSGHKFIIWSLLYLILYLFKVKIIRKYWKMSNFHQWLGHMIIKDCFMVWVLCLQVYKNTSAF